MGLYYKKGIINPPGRGGGISTTVLTVGAGAQFSTVTQALTYISGLTLMDEIDHGSLTCTTTQHSDVVELSGEPIAAGIKPGDWFWIDNDATPTLFGSHSDHYYPIMQVGGQRQAPDDSDRLLLHTGIAGAAQASVAFKIYRPEGFSIFLAPGEHDLENATIPNGARITIYGAGESTVVVGSPLLFGRYGNVHLHDLYGSETNIIAAANEIIVFPNLYEGFGKLIVNDVRLSTSYVPGSTTDVMQTWEEISCAAFSANNVSIDGIFDHGHLPIADYLNVSNYFISNYDSTESMFFIAHPYRCNSTKEKNYKNVSVARYAADPDRGPPENLDFNCGTIHGQDIVFNLEQVTCSDDSNSSDTSTAYNVKFTCPSAGSNNLVVNYTNSTMKFTGAHDEDIHITGDRFELNMRNVKRENGDSVTFTSGAKSAGATIYRDDDDSYEAIAYGATITPDAGRSKNWDVGQLTGNITVAAPTNPQTNRVLRFMFESDGSARTITWNAAFKVHTNPASTASLKAVYEFKYDGTHWIQTNTPVWV